MLSTWAADARGPTSSGLLAPSDISYPSTLLSQESDKVAGPAYTVSMQERAWYYYGITSKGEQPELLYRTSWEKDPWLALAGRFAKPPLKFARLVYNTPLNGVWDTVSPLINDLVNATIKRSYSINTARFFTVPNGKDAKEGTLSSAVIWISIYPDSTSAKAAHEVSQAILQLLTNNNVDGVDVEWCEGVTLRLVTLPLLPVVGKCDATVHVSRHLTTALSIPIASANAEGTGGFYFHKNLNENGNPGDRVLLVTNHHVLCKDEEKSYDFRANSSPHQEVWVCAPHRFEQGLDDIDTEVVYHEEEASACAIEIGELEAKILRGDGNEGDDKNLKKALQEHGEHQAAICRLRELYKTINVSWSSIRHHNIGYLEYSPPISVDINNKRYTQDWATI